MIKAPSRPPAAIIMGFAWTVAGERDEMAKEVSELDFCIRTKSC